MKKFVIIICFGLLVVACKNKQATNTSYGNGKNPIQIAHERDSINREKIFEALGDTVFGKICYGMSSAQYQKAIEAFMKPLREENRKGGFTLGNHSFAFNSIIQVEENEKNIDKPYNTYIDNLEYFLSGDKEALTLFYKGQLISVGWRSLGHTKRTREDVTDSYAELISYFEKRYGQPNIDNSEDFDSYLNESGRTNRDKVVAKWETDKRKIVIYYQELYEGEKNKHISSSWYQYDVEVLFLNKELKKDLNENYIKPRIQKIKDKEEEKKKQLQKNMENAL